MLDEDFEDFDDFDMDELEESVSDLDTEFDNDYADYE